MTYTARVHARDCGAHGIATSDGMNHKNFVNHVEDRLIKLIDCRENLANWYPQTRLRITHERAA